MTAILRKTCHRTGNRNIHYDISQFFFFFDFWFLALFFLLCYYPVTLPFLFVCIHMQTHDTVWQNIKKPVFSVWIPAIRILIDLFVPCICFLNRLFPFLFFQFLILIFQLSHPFLAIDFPILVFTVFILYFVCFFFEFIFPKNYICVFTHPSEVQKHTQKKNSYHSMELLYAHMYVVQCVYFFVCVCVCLYFMYRDLWLHLLGYRCYLCYPTLVCRILFLIFHILQWAHYFLIGLLIHVIL